MTTNGKVMPKYARVADAVRAQIAAGTLRPGQPAPSGAALSRVTGFSTLTCRKALRVLIADGALVPGPSRNARPRVAGPPQPPVERDLAATGRALAAGLAGRRRANGLTQPELARRVGVSVTTVGHAETGRLWQSRKFWERADGILGAGGDLVGLHDAYRAAVASGAAETAAGRAPGSGPHGTLQTRGGAAARRDGLADGRVPEPRERWDTGTPGPGAAETQGEPGPGQSVPAYVVIMWSDGTVTTVHPPETPTQTA